MEEVSWILLLAYKADSIRGQQAFISTDAWTIRFVFLHSARRIPSVKSFVKILLRVCSAAFGVQNKYELLYAAIWWMSYSITHTSPLQSGLLGFKRKLPWCRGRPGVRLNQSWTVSPQYYVVQELILWCREKHFPSRSFFSTTYTP